MNYELLTKQDFYAKINLFEHYDLMPESLKIIADKYNEILEDSDNQYKDLEKFLLEINEIGYTFDYYLDAVPYDLRPISMSEQLKLEALIDKEEGIDKVDFVSEMVDARIKELNQQFVDALIKADEKLANEILDEVNFLNSYYKGERFIDQVYLYNKEIVTEIDSRLNNLLRGKEDFYIDLHSEDGNNVLSWALKALDEHTLNEKLISYFNTAFRQEVESWDANETSEDYIVWKFEYDEIKEELCDILNDYTFIPSPININHRIQSDKWASELDNRTSISNGLSNNKVAELQSNHYTLSRVIAKKEGVPAARYLPSKENHLYESIFSKFAHDSKLKDLLQKLRDYTIENEFRKGIQIVTNLPSLSSFLNLYFEIKDTPMWDFAGKTGKGILKTVLDYLENPVLNTIKDYFNLSAPQDPSLAAYRIADESEYDDKMSLSQYENKLTEYESTLNKIIEKLEQENVSLTKLNSLNILDEYHVKIFNNLTDYLQSNINNLKHIKIMEPNQSKPEKQINEIEVGKLASVSRPDFFFKGKIKEFDSGSATIVNLNGEAEKFAKKDIYLFFPGQKYDRREIEDLFTNAPGKLDFSQMSKEDLTKLMRGELTTSIFNGTSYKDNVEKEYQFKIRTEFNSEHRKLELKPYFKHDQQIDWSQKTVFGKNLSDEQIDKLVDGKSIVLNVEKEEKNYSVKVHYDSDINQVVFDNFVNKTEKASKNKLEFKDNFEYEEFLRNDVTMFDNASKVNLHQLNKAILILDLAELNEFLTDFSIENSKIDILINSPGILRGNDSVEVLKAGILQDINSSSEKVDLFKEKFKSFSQSNEQNVNVKNKI
ncbi:hypothetical protein [Chryseobacterium oncorhynchi]|uniref:Uncharacterized protein n=1 Tax=Chryseobacterium oncorhynchi TaxID=741074 RepID=A0A316WHV7_9FLAO|nr:hypothetical protein [Chryseobacterium oncorhynchi]PWN59963.1 hypothetical protein C1638_020565 [Chryseobacterium oncorhynchi]